MKKPEWLKWLNRANIRAFMKTDRAVLIACIGAALLFWFINRLNQTFRVEYNIPIVYNLPTGSAFLTVPPGNVKVVVTAKGWSLVANKIRGGDRSLKISIENPYKEIIITSSQLKNLIMEQIGRNEEIMNISLDQIILLLDKKVTRKVDLQLHTDIHFAKGFQLSAPIKTNLEQIEVSGPQQLVDSIKSWETDTLVVNNINHSEEFETGIKKYPNSMVQFVVDKIKASVSVEQSTEKRSLVKLDSTLTPKGCRIFPDIINITCNVALSHFQEASVHDFEISLNLPENAELKEKGTFTISVNKRKVWIEIVDFHPKSLNYSRL